jgi:hypothetical protein
VNTCQSVLQIALLKVRLRAIADERRKAIEDEERKKSEREYELAEAERARKKTKQEHKELKNELKGKLEKKVRFSMVDWNLLMDFIVL